MTFLNVTIIGSLLHADNNIYYFSIFYLYTTFYFIKLYEKKDTCCNVD